MILKNVESWRSWRLGGLLLLLLLAFGLRLVNLGGRTLWYDEAFAVLFAEKGPAAMLYGTLTPVPGGAADIHPLLYYVTLGGWMGMFGQSPEMVRLLSVFAGLLTVAVLYRLAADLFGARTGLVAALIAALSPFHVQYSQEARMYALQALLLLLATWAYLRAWRGRGRGWWLAFGVLAALAMYTQQLAAFYLAALGLTPVLARRKDRLWPTLAAAGLAVLLYLPWAINLPGQVGKLQAYYWIPRPSIVRPLLTLRSFVTVALDYPSAWNLPAFFAAAALTVMLVVQAVIRWRWMRSSERRALVWMLWLAFGALAFMWIASQVLTPVYLDRALLAQGVIFYAALAWLFARGGLPRPILAVLIVLWGVVGAAGLYYHLTWRTFPNSPFDEAAAWLVERAEVGDAIVHSNKLTALPMMYYARALPQRYIGDRPGSPEDTLALPTQEALGLIADGCAAQAAGGAARVWFVIFAQEEAQYLGLPDVEEHPHLGWLRAHYHEGRAVAFEDLLIVSFDQPDALARSVPACEESAP